MNTELTPEQFKEFTKMHVCFHEWYKQLSDILTRVRDHFRTNQLEVYYTIDILKAYDAMVLGVSPVSMGVDKMDFIVFGLHDLNDGYSIQNDWHGSYLELKNKMRK